MLPPHCHKCHDPFNGCYQSKAGVSSAPCITGHMAIGKFQFIFMLLWLLEYAHGVIMLSAYVAR